ncbi:MAG: hypothetical protein ACTSXC_07135 [Candidatus Freyarchaeota archaeon]
MHTGLTLGDGSLCSRRPAEVLDLIVKVLREHERWLDGFAKELKAIVDRPGRLEPKRAETAGMPVFDVELGVNLRRRVERRNPCTSAGRERT